MTRYAEIEKALRRIVSHWNEFGPEGGFEESVDASETALALPEDSKVVNAELYGLAVELADSAARSDIECVCATAPGGGYWIRGNDADVDRAVRYLELREASGETMPYKVVRDGDKVRFDVPAQPKDGE